MLVEKNNIRKVVIGGPDEEVVMQFACFIVLRGEHIQAVELVKSKTTGCFVTVT